MECENCDGNGNIIKSKAARELVEPKEMDTECDECDGTGFVCDHCGEPVSIERSDFGFCNECAR